MIKKSQYFAAFLLSASLVAPAAMIATPRTQDQDHQEHRYYDREHKDYHKWDDKEQSAWGRFLDEKHKKHRDFERATKQERSEYWSWRHEHPDSDR